MVSIFGDAPGVSIFASPMRKVYLVTPSPLAGYDDLEGVFSTMDKARDFIRGKPESYDLVKIDHYISEVDVDVPF